MNKHVQTVMSACLLISLSACLPFQSRAGASVAVLNGPSEYRIAGLAEQFEEVLKTQPEASLYRFSPSAALRYQETHRDLHGSRAPLQAAFAARSQGAAYAVLVGVDAETSVENIELEGDRLEVELSISGKAQVSLVEATSADRLGTFTSAPFRARAFKTVDFTLPEGVAPESLEGRRLINQRAQELREAATVAFSKGFEEPLRELAEPVASELARLFTQSLKG